MNKLLTTVTLDRLNRKKDRSISITFITQTEKTSEELMEMDKLLNDSGVLYFKSNGQLTKEEIKELDNVEIEVEGKSKSQRLRSVLFILWQQEGEKGTFNDFYAERMEKLITQIKDRLN